MEKAQKLQNPDPFQQKNGIIQQLNFLNSYLEAGATNFVRMKKQSHLHAFLLFTSLIWLMSSCTNRAYVAPKVEWGITKKQHSVAIIPFDVITKVKRLPKDITMAELREKDRKDALSMQRDLYRYFIRGMSNKGFELNFIQDINQTNDILEEHGISYEEIKRIPRYELAELLKVEAIILGTISQENDPFFSSILVGDFQNGQTVNATFMLYQKQTDKLLWRFEGKASGTPEDDVYALCKKVMRLAPEKFPFEIL